MAALGQVAGGRASGALGRSGLGFRVQGLGLRAF